MSAKEETTKTRKLAGAEKLEKEREAKKEAESQEIIAKAIALQKESEQKKAAEFEQGYKDLVEKTGFAYAAVPQITEMGTINANLVLAKVNKNGNS